MLTPQEIQDKKFDKALFNGYDMAQVDQFLDSVLTDYTSLYKENATLKAKMRVLVEKIEEYRAVDEEMRKALYTAQMTAKEIISKATSEAELMLSKTRSEAEASVAAVRKEAEIEQLRFAAAKASNNEHIEKIKEMMRRNIDIMDSILMQNPDSFQKEEKPKPRGLRPEARDDFEVTLPEEVMEGPGAPKLDTPRPPAKEEPEEPAFDAEGSTTRFNISFQEQATGKIAEMLSLAMDDDPAAPAPVGAPAGPKAATMETRLFEVELGGGKKANIASHDADISEDDEEESDTGKIYGDTTFTPKPRFDFSDMRFGKDYKEEE